MKCKVRITLFVGVLQLKKICESYALVPRFRIQTLDESRIKRILVIIQSLHVMYTDILHLLILAISRSAHTYRLFQVLRIPDIKISKGDSNNIQFMPL